MIKKILKFPFSKRGGIYTATILTLFFLGNAYTKHKFHEKAVEELQTALKADKVTSNEIFGSRQQYVAISHEEPTYYNSEDNVATEMIGRNHFVRYYDTMSSLHQAHLVVYDINKDFKKKIINLTPYLKKVKDFKEIKELAVSLRTIDGYDYVFLRNTRSDKQFAYNLDTNQFLTSNLPDYSYSKDELLYENAIIRCRANQLNEIEKQDMIAVYRDENGVAVLVHNYDGIRGKYKNLLVDQVTLDEIMKIMIKGELV